MLETSRMVHITPSKRNTLTTQHRAYAADLEEYRWLLKHGVTEIWYEKPSRAYLKQMKALEGSGCEPKDLSAIYDARPVSLETTKVWASRALTTPTDDDVYGCTVGHITDGGYTGACHQCSEEKSEALEETALVYSIVLTTYQASNPFIHGSHFNGKPIYKVIRCGSRDAATAEAFYAAGVNGWNVAFSCVTRLDETFEERSGKTKKVDELWMLAEGEEDKETIRVFY
jgi:hypothetical protein